MGVGEKGEDRNENYVPRVEGSFFRGELRWSRYIKLELEFLLFIRQRLQQQPEGFLKLEEAVAPLLEQTAEDPQISWSVMYIFRPAPNFTSNPAGKENSK